jgi:hypothetical protein
LTCFAFIARNCLFSSANSIALFIAISQPFTNWFNAASVGLGGLFVRRLRYSLIALDWSTNSAVLCGVSGAQGPCSIAEASGGVGVRN